MIGDYTTQRIGYISSLTDFDAGPRFADAQAVRAYFTVSNMLKLGYSWADMVDDEECWQDELDAFAQDVIRNEWHMLVIDE